MATATVEQFTDPFSPWCWAAQPALRRLRYEFDDAEWTPRMTVLLPDSPSDSLSDSPSDPNFGGERVTGGDANDEATGFEDADEEGADELRVRFAEAAAATGMPVADELWPDRLPDSRPACATVAFVRETAPDRALSVLRRLQEAAFADGWAIDDPADVASVAGRVDGVEETAVLRAFEDGRAASALEADLERAVDVADELDVVDVRGDVSVLPAAPRLGSTPTDVTGGDGSEVNSDDRGDPDDGRSEMNGDEGSERETSGGMEANEDEAREPALMGPPALRVETGSATIVDPRLPFGRLSTVLGRSTPRTGFQMDDKYATSHMAMHVPREVAESLSSQDFGATVRPYLARFGRAYLAEVVAGTGVSADTCRDALASLVERGEAEQVGPAEWRTVDEPGGPRRDT